MKKKSLVCLLLALNLMSVTVFADVEQDVINAQAQYEEYQKSVDETTAQIVKFNSEIEECLSNIDSYESQLDSLNAEIENNELLIKTLEEEIKSTEELKGKRLREYHKSGGALNYLSLIFDADNFSDLVNKAYITTKLMKIDREMIQKVSDDKKQLDEILVKQENNRFNIKSILKDLEDTKVSLEDKKSKQEELLNNLKIEQETFGKEVLEVAEINLLAPQEEMINSSDSISTINSAISQLQSLIDNQLTMEGSINKAISLMEIGRGRIEELEEQERQRLAEIERQQMLNSQVTVTPNRGDSTYIPPSGSVTGQDIVNYAYQFLGLPYVWGAVGPDTFDCSGFTSYVYRHCAGIEITRTTYTQINVGKPVSYSEMQPGDLVFTYDNEHVGIYVGGGMYINATMPGSTIKVTPVTNFYAARRIL